MRFSPYPQMECCQNIHPNTENPFLYWPCHLRPQFTCHQMVSHNAIIWRHPASPRIILMTAQNISPWLTLWKLWFQKFIPLSPPGTKLVIHKSPEQRTTWVPYDIEGWYIRPSTKNYHCHKCYILSTVWVRDTLTLNCFPKQIPFP